MKETIPMTAQGATTLSTIASALSTPAVTPKTCRPVCPAAKELPCPACGEDAFFTINLGMLDGQEGCECFQCQACDAVFGFGQMADVIRRWGKILTWLAALPVMDDTE